MTDDWKENLDNTDKIQENQYAIPYHWFFEPSDFRGRKYFSYLNSCVKYAIKNGKSISESKILDAGCGDARFIKVLLDAGAKEVEGLDYSEQALSFARAFLPQVKFHRGDLANYALQNQLEKFDIVYLVETLEHIPVDDVPKVLANLNLLLNTGGLLIITVPSTLLPLQDKHYQHFTPEKLQGLCEHRFTVKEIIGYSKVSKHPLSILYKFFDNRIWQLKPLSSFYNTKIWPKYFGECDPKEGEGLLIVCQKSN